MPWGRDFTRESTADPLAGDNDHRSHEEDIGSSGDGDVIGLGHDSQPGLKARLIGMVLGIPDGLEAALPRNGQS